MNSIATKNGFRITIFWLAEAERILKGLLFSLYHFKNPSKQNLKN